MTEKRWFWWDTADISAPLHWTIHRGDDRRWFLTIILYRDMYLEMQHGPMTDPAKYEAFMKLVMFKFEDIDAQRGLGQ